MANIITGSRIVFSMFLLVCEVFSPRFYIFYILAGITDMIDGTVARKTNTVSKFGSRLDTIADVVFTFVCLFKILQVLRIPFWLWIWIGVIAVIKVVNIVMGFVLHHKYCVEHTILNKITGGILFVLPFVLPVINLKYSISVVCIVAIFAAIQEGYYIWKGKEVS